MGFSRTTTESADEYAVRSSTSFVIRHSKNKALSSKCLESDNDVCIDGAGGSCRGGS